jgi:hypothetical protein
VGHQTAPLLLDEKWPFPAKDELEPALQQRFRETGFHSWAAVNPTWLMIFSIPSTGWGSGKKHPARLSRLVIGNGPLVALPPP